MEKYFLEPRYDYAKSFYGKAVVKEDEYSKRLYSYETLVCEINEDEVYVYGTYSDTTLRHIKEFLKQNGFKAETKKQILKDYFMER